MTKQASPNRFWICTGLLLACTSIVQGIQAKDTEKQYSAASRLDPFDVPSTGSQAEVCAEGRPKVVDLDVSGVFVVAGVSVAQAEAGKRNFLLRAGDQLCDGTVVSVDTHVVTMKDRLGETTTHTVGGSGSQRTSDCVVSEIVGTAGARVSCQSELRSLDTTSEK